MVKFEALLVEFDKTDVNGITNVQCVYSSNTTIFIGRMSSIFYIRYNYMFRRLIMA